MSWKKSELAKDKKCTVMTLDTILGAVLISIIKFAHARNICKVLFCVNNLIRPRPGNPSCVPPGSESLFLEDRIPDGVALYVILAK